jgi:hypothetical protein
MRDVVAGIIVIGGLALVVGLVILGVRRLSSRNGALPFAGRDLFLVVGGVVFLLIAIPMTIFSDDHLTGAGCVAFSLAVIALPISSRVGGGGGRTRAQLDGRRVVIRGLRAKLWTVRAVLAVALVGGVIWFVEGTDSNRYVGLLMAVCFGSFLVIGVVMGGGSYQLIVDESGLHWRLGGKRKHAGWSELSGVDVYDIRGTWF